MMRKNKHVLDIIPSSDVYHTTFDWPGNPEVQERLEEPEGQSEEAMVQRLVLYHRHLHGILRCFGQVVKTVNADQPKADVFSQGETQVDF